MLRGTPSAQAFVTVRKRRKDNVERVFALSLVTVAMAALLLSVAGATGSGVLPDRRHCGGHQ